MGIRRDGRREAARDLGMLALWRPPSPSPRAVARSGARFRRRRPRARRAARVLAAIPSPPSPTSVASSRKVSEWPRAGRRQPRLRPNVGHLGAAGRSQPMPIPARPHRGTAGIFFCDASTVYAEGKAIGVRRAVVSCQSWPHLYTPKASVRRRPRLALAYAYAEGTAYADGAMG